MVMGSDADVATEVVGRHCLLVAGSDLNTWVAVIGRAVAGGPVPRPLDLPD